MVLVYLVGGVVYGKKVGRHASPEGLLQIHPHWAAWNGVRSLV
eukprot:SAG11_NODE_29904_length_306_cov_0.589372_1_plen_42_part_10